MCELNQADYARCLGEDCNAMVLTNECSNPSTPLCPRHDHSEYNRIFADLLKPNRSRVRDPKLGVQAYDSDGREMPGKLWR